MISYKYIVGSLISRQKLVVFLVVTLQQRPRILAILVSATSGAGIECDLIPDVATHVLFETGGEELKLMEAKVYVASGRFVLEESKLLMV